MPEWESEDEIVTGKREERGSGREGGALIHLLLVGPAPVEMFGLIETIFFQWLCAACW